MNILGCNVSHSLLEAWGRRLVFEREPIFVTPEQQPLLPKGVVLLTREELRANHALAPLDLWDSYSLYQMAREGLEVAFLTPAEVAELPAEARQEIMISQDHRGRGQIYEWGWFDKLGIRLSPDGRDQFTTEDKIKIALRYDQWWALTSDQREQWLTLFVSRDRHPCLAQDLHPDQWERMERLHGPQIRALAGTFAPVSGPNCYAATLAAATPSVPPALSIAGHWLHPAPLLRGLAERGYAVSSLPATDDAMPPGAVLLFRDQEQRLQHASFYMGDGLVLNKDAQSWFSPRQVLPLKVHLGDWYSDGWTIEVWIRG